MAKIGRHYRRIKVPFDIDSCAELSHSLPKDNKDDSLDSSSESIKMCAIKRREKKPCFKTKKEAEQEAYERKIEKQQKTETKYDSDFEEIRLKAEQLFNERYKMKLPKESDKKKEEEPLKDCLHLTKEDLKTYFIAMDSDLSDIRLGTRPCDRHHRYLNNINTRTLSDLDLRYSESTSYFSDDQIKYILELMRQKYQKSNSNSNKLRDLGARKVDTLNYFYEVLIPEFCAKVYYEVYDVVINS